MRIAGHMVDFSRQDPLARLHGEKTLHALDLEIVLVEGDEEETAHRGQRDIGGAILLHGYRADDALEILEQLRDLGDGQSLSKSTDPETLGIAGGYVFLVGGMEAGQRVTDRVWYAEIERLMQAGDR